MYCPDHDPLTRAGHLGCHRCGRVAYPTDAAWFGDLILATYPAPCERGAPSVWLVAPEELKPPEFCGALTRSFEPCRIRTGGGRCHHHRGQDRGRR